MTFRYYPRLLHDTETDPEVTAFVLSLFRHFSTGNKKMSEEDMEELLGVIDDVQGFKDDGKDLPRYISRKHIMAEFGKVTKLKRKDIITLPNYKIKLRFVTTCGFLFQRIRSPTTGRCR